MDSPRLHRQRLVFLIAVAVIALHVLDDSFVQPEPGTSAADHLVSGLVPLAALGIAAVASQARDVNAYDALLKRARDCQRIRHHLPNLVR